MSLPLAKNIKVIWRLMGKLNYSTFTAGWHIKKL